MRAEKAYLEDILSYINKISEFTRNVKYDEFLQNEEKVLAVLHCFQIIGEAGNRLSRSFTENYPNIPWADITGMRNFIVHGYFHIDIEIIWKTIIDDLPALKNEISKILDVIQED